MTPQEDTAPREPPSRAVDTANPASRSIEEQNEQTTGRKLILSGNRHTGSGLRTVSNNLHQSGDGSASGDGLASCVQPESSMAVPLNSGSEEVADHVESTSIDTRTHQPAGIFVRYATYLLVMPLIALATIVCGSISLVVGVWDTSGRQQHAIARVWASVLLRISLSPVEVVHPERLRNAPLAVYAANHLSYMDTPVLFAKLPFQFRILAKSGLWKIPFIGWYLNRSGQVAVDQSSARASIASLGRGVNALKDGVPLMIFPEGGRADDGRTKPFLSGCAWMAIRAGVPIVPLAIVGTYEMLPIHTYHLLPRPLRMIVCEPIPTEGFSTRDASRLTEELQASIANALAKDEQEHPV
jgi:1-acyl-sn-glycerol-3-phosphate acyltransferase